ncbi:hypothetical protein ANO11243_048120 [Dothideomycetidae sp. 11243]|nr:hypothetical protein ANO11243_048120 [fungal sp. No.11243]
MARQNKKLKSLSAGRTAICKQDQSRFSARKGRTIIRSHHQLSKALADAEKTGDDKLVTQLRKDIERNGGLATYQQASLLGQSNDRGGDSSKVLVDWLKPRMAGRKRPLRVLEVGALSLTNACSQWDLMAVTRIDLNSQTSGILQQDFMQRPLPKTSAEKFDVISLSLVLNFVPSKEGRGQMLQRTSQFLESRADQRYNDEDRRLQPCLFLVLPRPCVINSRYMTEERLGAIMSSLGYSLSAQKSSPRLVYMLWEYRAEAAISGARFSKEELNPGFARNNFSIVL